MNRRSRNPLLSTTACMLVAVALPASAQDAPTTPPVLPAGQTTAGEGVITGRVLDPATGDYLRNATVTVETADGRRRSTISGEGGEYRIAGIAAGPAKVTIEYTGYQDSAATVEVAANQTVQHDVNVVRPRRDSADTAQDVVVTASFLEGDARAIMDQRQSMDIKNNLSVESYGDISDGNPAEFLKFMPGVDIDGTEGTTRNVQLRGMPSNYTGVTFDGLSLARADVGTGAGGSRTFSFDSANMGGLESIEISKTTSADMPADSPAGTINFRSARAFNRKKRRMVFQFSGTTHAALLDAEKRTGPGEGGYGGKRFLPNGSFSFADSFFDRRLGISFNIDKSNLYIERESLYLNRNYVPTAVSPQPLVPTSIELHDEPRTTSRLSGAFNVDFKATDSLILSFSSGAYHNTIWKSEIEHIVTTGARAVGVIGDPLFDFTTNQGANTATLQTRQTATRKISTGTDFIPGFEFNRGGLRIEGKAFFSDSEGHYDLPAKEGQISALGTANTITARGNFSVERTPDLARQDWTINQVSGADWASTGAFTLNGGAPVIRLNDGATAKARVRGGKGDVTWNTQFGQVPMEFKTGFLLNDKAYEYHDRSDLNIYRYTGTLTNAQFLDAVRSTNQVNFGNSGVSISSLSGGDIYVPSLTKIGTLYYSNPSAWVNQISTANWYNAYVASERNFRETILSAYGMATGDIGSWLKLRAGLRWEQTKNTVVELDPLSPDEVVAKGFAVGTNGRATTIPGLELQYLSRPTVERKRTYDYFFPSASAKVIFAKDLTLHLGYSRTISRPEISVLAGVWAVDDTNNIVRAPNPGLEPSISDNFSARLSYFFEPVSMVAINFYQNRIKGLFQEQELTAAEYGNTDPRFDTYTFITTAKVPGDAVDIRGIELEFSHSMSYLPSPLNGLAIRGSFMYNDPSVPIVRVADKVASFSVSYKKGPVQLFFNALWNDDKYRSTTPSWFERRLEASLSGQIQIIKQVETFFSVRNLFKTPVNVLVPGSLATTAPLGNHSAIYVNNGRSGVVGVRARF